MLSYLRLIQIKSISTFLQIQILNVHIFSYMLKHETCKMQKTKTFIQNIDIELTTLRAQNFI